MFLFIVYPKSWIVDMYQETIWIFSFKMVKRIHGKDIKVLGDIQFFILPK